MCACARAGSRGWNGDADQTYEAAETKKCDWMSEQEKDLVIELILNAENLTIEKWKADGDVKFRSGIAENLVSLRESAKFDAADFAYVAPSPRLLSNDTLQIYIFLNGDENTEKLALALSGHGASVKRSDVDLMQRAVRNAVSQIPKNFGIYNNVTSAGLPGMDCSSLFYSYLRVWIGLIVLAFLCIVLSITLTWYCWKRGKSVQLKQEKPIDLPTADELRDLEMGGEDNPALVIGSEDSPSKKKQAPLPPTSTPTMTTFGKNSKTSDSDYETGIVPYEAEDKSIDDNEPKKIIAEVEDTKL